MPMREIVESNILIDTIIGDQGGTTAVEGPIEHSSAIPGTALIPVYFFDNYVNSAGYRCTPGNTMQLTFQGSC